MLRILLGGTPIDSGTFEENNVVDGARLSAIVPVNPQPLMECIQLWTACDSSQ